MTIEGEKPLVVPPAQEAELILPTEDDLPENERSLPEAEVEADADQAEAETEADEPEQDQKEQPKKPTGSQRLKEKNAALKAEIDDLRRRVDAGSNGASDLDSFIGPEPKESDFSSYLDFERATNAWHLRKTQVEFHKTLENQRTQTVSKDLAAKQVERFQGAIEEAKETLTDIVDVLTKAPPASDHVRALIFDSDHPAHLAYHLAKDANVIARLNGMSPAAAAREIGRIEGKMSQPQPRTQSKAPAPSTSLRGSAAPTRDVSKMSDAEAIAYFEKQDAAERKRREG